jgi:hypothetical protein
LEPQLIDASPITPGLCDLTAQALRCVGEARPLSVGVRSNPPIFPRKAGAQLFKLNWSEAIILMSECPGPLCTYVSGLFRWVRHSGNPGRAARWIGR